MDQPTFAFVMSSGASVAAAPRKPAPAAPIVTLTWRFEMPADNDTIEQHVALRVTRRSVSNKRVQAVQLQPIARAVVLTLPANR